MPGILVFVLSIATLAKVDEEVVGGLGAIVNRKADLVHLKRSKGSNLAVSLTVETV